jgi:hypothetical protein
MGETTASAARDGLAKEANVRDEYHKLRTELRESSAAFRAEMAALRADMNAMKWWLFGALSVTILAATAAIIAAVAVWG